MIILDTNVLSALMADAPEPAVVHPDDTCFLQPHMRGELWSQIAFAADRLGDKPERDRYIELMLTQLKGSLYEKRAERWQKLPALTTEADNMCISCHEPGRLKPTAARLGVTLSE